MFAGILFAVTACLVLGLGFAAPLTGPQAHYGEEYKNGVTLAIEDANAEKPTIDGKPVKFELMAEDDLADEQGQGGDGGLDDAVHDEIPFKRG